MEEIISIMGAIVGIVSVISALRERYRITIKNHSISVRVAGADGEKEIKLSDIDHLTKEEVSQLLQTLSEKKNND